MTLPSGRSLSYAQRHAFADQGRRRPLMHLAELALRVQCLEVFNEDFDEFVCYDPSV